MTLTTKKWRITPAAIHHNFIVQ